MIRTFKDMFFKRVEADEKKNKENILWLDYILEIMLTYNKKMRHSATGMTPKKARKKDNWVESKTDCSIKSKIGKDLSWATCGRQSEDHEEKMITEKQRTSHFLKGEYVVESISEKLNQTYYRLTDYPRPRSRHEPLKM